MISVQRRRICPACLRDNAYHRAIWDLVIIDNCPLHNHPLMCICPSCGRTLRWNAPSAAHCACGCDLSRSSTTTPQAGPCAARSIAQILACPIPGLKNPQGIASGPVERLDPGERLTLIFHLGWWASGAHHMPRPIALSVKGFAFHNVLMRGLHACEEWPNGFIALLDELRANAIERPGRFGAVKTFGPMAGWLEALPDGPLSKLLVSGLATYAAARGGTPTRSTSARIRAADTAWQMTLTQASKLLRRSVVRTHTLLAADGFISENSCGSGAPVRVDRRRVRALKSEIDGLLRISGLASALGCGKPFAKAVAASKVISLAEGLASDFFGHPCWRREDVTAFLADLEARSAADDHVPSVPCVKAIQILRRKRVSASRAVDALISGALEVAAIDPTANGLNRLLVSDRSLNQILSEGRKGTDALFSIPEAGRLLGVKDEVVYAWARSGLLRTCTRTTPGQRGQGVSQQALIDFRTEFVRGQELQASLKVKRGWAAARLISYGVTPLSGPSVDQSPFFLFRRKAALEAWLKMEFPLRSISASAAQTP